MDLLDRRPDSPEWRADALARSGHSRLDAEGFLPTCHPDQLPEARSGDPCAEICRELLGDFAPALLLLAAPARRRVQALAAFTRALDDCAREQGTEGQRLAALNRWEFALESALDGAPSAHPAFAAMARAEALQPWPRSALGALFARARRRALRGDADRGAVAELVPALGAALFGEPPPARLAALGVAILNAPRPSTPRPHPQGSVPRTASGDKGATVTSQNQSVFANGTALADAGAIRDAPPQWRKALRYALLTARAHAGAVRSGRGARNLSAVARFLLLARARWPSGGT